MTEKYFKYLIKQSLPLFALILIFGLLFSLGFINPDNLPAYLVIVSLAIPFLFQFWQFRRKTAYTYGALPMDRKKFVIARDQRRSVSGAGSGDPSSVRGSRSREHLFYLNDLADVELDLPSVSDDFAESVDSEYLSFSGGRDHRVSWISLVAGDDP